MILFIELKATIVWNGAWFKHVLQLVNKTLWVTTEIAYVANGKAVSDLLTYKTQNN